MLSNKKVPQGKQIEQPQVMFEDAPAAPRRRCGGRAHDHGRRRDHDHRGGRRPADEFDGRPGRRPAGAAVLPRDLDLGRDRHRRWRPRDPRRARRPTPSPPGTCARSRVSPRQGPGHLRDLSPGVPALLPAGRPALLVHPRRGVPGQDRPLQLPRHRAEDPGGPGVRLLVRPAGRLVGHRDGGRRTTWAAPSSRSGPRASGRSCSK